MYSKHSPDIRNNKFVKESIDKREMKNWLKQKTNCRAKVSDPFESLSEIENIKLACDIISYVFELPKSKSRIDCFGNMSRMVLSVAPKMAKMSLSEKQKYMKRIMHKLKTRSRKLNLDIDEKYHLNFNCDTLSEKDAAVLLPLFEEMFEIIEKTGLKGIQLNSEDTTSSN